MQRRIFGADRGKSITIQCRNNVPESEYYVASSESLCTSIAVVRAP